MDGSKEGTEIDITLKVDFSKYGRVIKTKEELDQNYVRHYGCPDIKELLEEGDWIAGQYAKALKAIGEGKIIIMGSFSDDSYDDPIESFLCNMGIPKDCSEVEIIHNEGGY